MSKFISLRMAKLFVGSFIAAIGSMLITHDDTRAFFGLTIIMAVILVAIDDLHGKA